MKYGKKISVVIPTLNEEKNLPLFIPHIPEYVDEIIIVDGNSKDNTVNVAKEMLPEAKILYQQGKGRGDAVKYGAKFVSGDYFVILDADASDDPRDIDKMCEKMNEGYDIIKGSRSMVGGSSDDETWLRTTGAGFLQFLVNSLWRTKYTDVCYGLIMLNTNKFHDLSIKSNGFEFEWELAIKGAKKKYKVSEVPSHENDRAYGVSKLHPFRLGFKILGLISKEYYNDIRYK